MFYRLRQMFSDVNEWSCLLAVIFRIIMEKQCDILYYKPAMPKENTHIWFASGLLDNVTDKDMIRTISGHMDEYYLGSVIPDTFYYSPDESIENISQVIHGKHGSPTNILIRNVLDEASGDNDISFILGFITHCAIDITLHPTINAACGDYYDPDPAARQKAVYLHRKIETYMDTLIHNRLRIHELVRPSLIEGLAFTTIVSRYFDKTPDDLRSTLRRQLLMNRLFTSSTAHALLRFLHGIGVMNSPEILALFYGDINRSPVLPAAATPQALASMSADAVRIMEMVPGARKRALHMMYAAWAYSRGQMTESELFQEIPGESLGTGEPPILSALRT